MAAIPAAVGTTLFSENFGGYSADDVPSGSVSTSTGNRVVYGGGSVTYACTNGDGTRPGTTKIYAEELATGASPELLIGKYGSGGSNGGTFSITGIPSGGAQAITVSFKQNKQKLKVAVSGTGYTSAGVDAKPSDAGTVSFDITVANNAAATFNLTFSVYSSNVRLDDILVTVKTAGETPKYAVSIDPAIEGGSVTITGVADLTKVEEGTELNVAATPDAENHYIGGVVTVTKTSDASDVTSTVYNSSTGKLTMPAYAVTVSATFTPTYKINLVAEGGSIALDYTAGGAEEGYAIEGTVISAEATADGTHTFKSLEVSDNAIDVTVLENLAEFTMPAAAVTVTATFDELQEPAINVDESALAFGEVDINSETEDLKQTFTISGVKLKSDLTLTITGDGKDAFSAACTTGSLTPNEDKEVAATVTVTPRTTVLGEYSATLTVAGGGLAEKDQKTVALTLTVKKRAAGISWAESTKTGIIGAAYTHPTLNNPNSVMVSLSSTDESVAYFDEGQIVLNAAGTTTIKATSVETDVYAQGVASYTLTVKEKFLVEWWVNGAKYDEEYVLTGEQIAKHDDPDALDAKYETKTFEGWSETQILTAQDEAPTFVTFPVDAAVKKFYAVFATVVSEEGLHENSYDLTSEDDDWVGDGTVTYFSQPYGFKSADAKMTNKSISDFADYANIASSITINVKCLQNGATDGRLLVSLVDKDGAAISGTDKEIAPVNASSATNTTNKEVSYSASEVNGKDATGYMISVSYFNKNMLVNGTSYSMPVPAQKGAYVTTVPEKTPTAIDNTEASVKAVKFIENGQLFIEKNGHVYNVQGQLIK